MYRIRKRTCLQQPPVLGPDAKNSEAISLPRTRRYRLAASKAVRENETGDSNCMHNREGVRYRSKNCWKCIKYAGKFLAALKDPRKLSVCFLEGRKKFRSGLSEFRAAECGLPAGLKTLFAVLDLPNSKSPYEFTAISQLGREPTISATNSAATSRIRERTYELGRDLPNSKESLRTLL